MTLFSLVQSFNMITFKNVLIKATIIILVFLIPSCKSSKDSNKNFSSSTSVYCPETGTCNLETLTSKNLVLLKDNIGSLYPEIQDGNHCVISFEFKKNVDPNLQDASYTELVIFELPQNFDKNVYENQDLEKLNMVFGRLCFCRGQTGYYSIKTGSLKFEEKEGELFFQLDFQIDEVPQIVSHIEGKIKA